MQIGILQIFSSKWIFVLVLFIVVLGGCKTPPTTETKLRIDFPENAERPQIALDITVKGKI
jgi:hypothetical protein